MTEFAKIERERQTTEAFMEKLRARGLVKPPQRLPDRHAEAIDGALALALEPEEPRRLYATPEQYRGWAQDPVTLTLDLHAEHCQAGMILVGEGAQVSSLVCPNCQAQGRAVELRKRLVAAGVDGRYLDVEWADLEQLAPLDRLARACGDIRGILDEGESLLLWSEGTGSGKTQAAMLAAKAAIAGHRTALVVNIARLAVEIRDGYGDRSGAALKESAVQRLLAAPDLLVIDDLGAGESDSAAIERRLLFLALDERQMHRRSTVVTSNLRPEELAVTFGARILARLSPLTIIHINHGKNFRLKPGRKSRW
ncbi:ATP-binding protein [Deinococcus aestuarii]|uniref:ATP-binding protein n=1 Tax=Deinococcus aestuarii TaxID=2774531 RepID=UPI001C0C0816|nr:ATP-binding protein [Deinococcus aestuarii]